MAITTSIPITVSADAAAHVKKLGMDRELERMLDHACQAAAGLRSIDVILMPPCDPGDDARVILQVTKDDPRAVSDPLWRQWCDWMVESFPPDVLRHFNLLTVYGATDEGQGLLGFGPRIGCSCNRSTLAIGSESFVSGSEEPSEYDN